MKTKKIFFLMLVLLLGFNQVWAQDSLIRHSVHVAPFVGLNSTFKAPVYGAEVGYEYRLNKNLGFTAGINIAYSQKNNPYYYDGNDISMPRANSHKLLQNAIYAGAKYYIRNFYISADLGYQDAYNTINYQFKGTGSNYNYGTTAYNDLYQSYGIGYQIPLKKGDNIDLFAKGSNANSTTSYVVGFRYNFGLFKRK